jgi:ATP-dependent Clp protease ATP-binding subunit ClpA
MLRRFLPALVTATLGAIAAATFAYFTGGVEWRVVGGVFTVILTALVSYELIDSWRGARPRESRLEFRHTRTKPGFPFIQRVSTRQVGPGPFDRFDDRAKRVLALAQDEAIRFNHNYIGTEHLLLGLVREGEGVAARVLDSLGVELAKVRTAVEFIIGRGDSTTSPSEITLSPRTKKVIELAIDEARKLGHSHVGTEHLLLGLVREAEGIGSGVLESLHVSLENVRQQVLKFRGVRPVPSGESRQGLFSHFDDGAKRALALAQEEATRLNHSYIGTEHLLLGLVHDERGVAGMALGSVGVDLEKARGALEVIVGRGDVAHTGEITLSPRAKKVIQFALGEATGFGDVQIGTGHLLLGLVRDADSVACGMLESLRVSPEAVRREVVAILESQRPGDQPSGQA